MSQATRTQRAWMAQFTDGEGHIGLRRRFALISGRNPRKSVYYEPLVTVANANTDAFELFLRFYEGNIRRRLEEAHQKPSLRWNCPVSNQEYFLKDIFPFLRIRQRRALLLLTYFNCRTPGEVPSPSLLERLDYIYNELKILNRKGRPMLELGTSPPSSAQIYSGGREPSLTERAGMAGFIDAEGCISLVKDGRVGYIPIISVGNTDPRGLNLFSEVYRGSCYKRDENNAVWKIRWVWHCATCDHKYLLWDLLPFLILKRSQAQLLLEYHHFKMDIRWNPEEARRREAIYQDLKRLNKKGI